ncbi:hypothetical protein L210DRAFT_2665192 [Boletus edulis BED1]|uniref:Uncharacterized protein n=1 Tax=Boletus edulis BED1 TaxID=1328754 RepID=A0AAD4C613_BOLED|nr:hypothetical protein L210DRAFT_2665192 [Boletus edulis BED1]
MMKLSYIFCTPKYIKMPGRESRRASMRQRSREFAGEIPSPWQTNLSEIRKSLEYEPAGHVTRLIIHPSY